MGDVRQRAAREPHGLPPPHRWQTLAETVDTLRGKLLIASASLVDPNFARSVVLVTEHGEEGALGIVLTRPSETSVAEGVPALEQLVEDDELVFVGGPVDPSAVLVLAELEDPGAASAVVFDRVGFLGADRKSVV